MDDELQQLIEEAIPEVADLFEIYGLEVTPVQLADAFEDAGLRIEFMDGNFG